MKNTISTMAVAISLVFGGIVASGATPAQTYQTYQTYPAQTYPSQTYPNQTYATQTYAEAGNSVGQTYSGTFTYGAPVVNAQPIVSAQPIYRSQPVTYSAGNSSSRSGSVLPGLAQRKAIQAAQRRLRGHVGGGLGGAKYEGVGWSNVSRQSAIQSCCYWGARPTAQIGCTRGPDGFWYACVLYH
jgi:hypothetical protein